MTLDPQAPSAVPQDASLPAPAAGPSRSSVTFILVTMLIESIGFGVMIPVLPQLFERFEANPTFVATWYGRFIALYALMQFLASPMLGNLSDRFGRRPVLLVSLFFGAIDTLVMAVAPNLWILFLGRAVAGLTGAVHTVASAFMADVSTPETRARNFGLVGAAFGVGFIIGPLLGGVVGHAFGPSAPFFAAAALTTINLIFGALVLPESLPPESRRPLSLSACNPLLMLKRIAKGRYSVPLIVIFALIFLAGQVHPSTWTLLAQHQYGWNTRDVGVSLALVGASMALVQGGLVRPLVAKLGEPATLQLGLVLSATAYGLFSVLSQGWMALVMIPLFGLAGVALPALQSLVANGVPANEQGELQGTLMAIGSLISVLAPILFTGLFSAFTTPDSGWPHFAGAPYLLASVVAVVALITWTVHKRHWRPQDSKISGKGGAVP